MQLVVKKHFPALSVELTPTPSYSNTIAPQLVVLPAQVVAHKVTLYRRKVNILLPAQSRPHEVVKPNGLVWLFEFGWNIVAVLFALQSRDMTTLVRATALVAVLMADDVVGEKYEVELEDSSEESFVIGFCFSLEVYIRSCFVPL